MKNLLIIVFTGLVVLLLGCGVATVEPARKPPASSASRADTAAQHSQDLKQRIEDALVASVQAQERALEAKKAGDAKAEADAQAEADRQAATARLLKELREQEERELTSLKEKAEKERKADAEAAAAERKAAALEASIERVRFYSLLVAGLGSLVGLAAAVAAWYLPPLRRLFIALGALGAGLVVLGGTGAMLAPTLAYSELASKVTGGIFLVGLVGAGIAGFRALALQQGGAVKIADYGHRLEDLVLQHVPDGEAVLQAIKDEAQEDAGKLGSVIQHAVDTSKKRLLPEFAAKAQEARDAAQQAIHDKLQALHDRLDKSGPSA